MTISAQTFVSLITLVVILTAILASISYLILLERKIAGWTQDRIGPNRVGFTFGFLPNRWHMFGLGQPIADGIKTVMKEDHNPNNVDKMLFIAAPALALIPALIGWSVIPWGGSIAIPDISLPLLTITTGIATVAVAPINVGIIFLLAMGSIAVYGIIIGGWASNNKFALIGTLRAASQMISYEIPMALIVLTILLLAGSTNASDIVNQQVGYWYVVIPKWNILQMPLAAALFYVCMLAESNRAPFDLPETETELVGGYHTEYSSLKWALFFMAEYSHMITASAFFAVLFLGGWHLPWLDHLIFGSPEASITGAGTYAGLLGNLNPTFAAVIAAVIKTTILIAKVFALLVTMMWIRWTLPRFRFDQLLRLAWRGLTPIMLLLLLTTNVMVHLNCQTYMWLANIALALLILIIIPLISQGPSPNIRIPLKGSRFSPLSND